MNLRPSRIDPGGNALWGSHDARELEPGMRRFELLAETARELLHTREPQRLVRALCERVMEHLDCQVFFNCIMDEPTGRLQLSACAGISSQEASSLDVGVAICGSVALDQTSLVADNVQNDSNPRSNWARELGVRAYACHPLLGPHGRLLGMLAFGTKTRDEFSEDELSLMKAVGDQVAIATVRQNDEYALRASEEALRESDHRKNEFLAVLSHELRNPLAPIRNSLHVLEHVPAGTEQAIRAYAVIHRQVAQLSRLVDDLLDLTRITRNKIVLQRELLELNKLVRRSAEDQHVLFEEALCRLEIDICDSPVYIEADPIRVSQAIGNLLQNAARFTDPGGHTCVTLSVEGGGQVALIRVADDGVGIAPEMMPYLFQPFMQADGSLDRKKGGLGLGLSLVKGLVELHGGEISVHSAGLGAGTEFAIRLPTVRPRSEYAERSSSAFPSAQSVPRRVLVIEDNEDAADTLREALQFGENVVEVAYSGPEGIRKAREFNPDVILCDIGLPGMTGYEVARALRQEVALRNVHLIALTGYALPEDQRRAAEAGFDRHLPKPSSIRSIQGLLTSLRHREG